jgi:membrane-anchored protein YejM (alkaline phosphatase superfamily)
MAQTRDLIQDSHIRFIFIHFPIPHPPGIYDRVHHVIRKDGSYLDNLVLADQSLAAVQAAIQSTPAAANTTLIVSSDHSWRPWVWQPLKEEEERVSHGGTFDPRAVLMVHLPGQDTSQVISKPVNVLIAHNIVESLLRGQASTPGDLDEIVGHQSQGKANVQVGN